MGLVLCRSGTGSTVPDRDSSSIRRRIKKYDSMTVVDTDELMELKKQAEEINKRIAELTAPKILRTDAR